MAALLGVSGPGRSAPLAVIWEDGIPVASGPAYQGPWLMNESRFHYVDDPTVAIDEDGGVGIAWVDQSRKDVFFQSYAPEGEPRLGRPVNVSRTPEVFSWLPRVVTGRSDPSQVHVLWQEIVFSGGTHGGEIFHARSTDGGKSFAAPVNLSRSVAGDGKGRLTRRYWDNGSLDLASGPAGTLYAAWTEYEGVLWFARSTDAGRRFSEPVRVAGGEGAKPARGPTLAAGAEGRVHLAWTVGEDATADIRIVSSRDGGRTFGPPRVVSASDTRSDAPKIAVDGTGGVHLAYGEAPASRFAQDHIRYTRSRDGGRTFEEPREVSGPLPEGFDRAGFPALDLDGEGNVYVLWELFPDGERRPRRLGFTVSGDHGSTFAAPSLVAGSAAPAHGDNGSRQGLLTRKLAVNPEGAIAVVNSTFRPGEASRVWLYRGRRVKAEGRSPGG